MEARKMLRLMPVFLSGIWLVGCISFNPQADDPLYAGYHRAGVSGGVTTAITDREVLIPDEVTDQQPPPGQPETGETLEDRDYTYPDWYRNRYLNEDAFRLNLSFHLYGPYYYQDFRTRYWLNYQYRWQRLPWYANGWMFDDLWWDYHFWNDWWYDPWYGYYDPWYSYYDPWYYGYPYNYYGGYGWYSSSSWRSWGPWYGTYTVRPAQTVATERRPDNRSDLPIGLDPGLTGDMTVRVTPQPGQSQLEYVSTRSAEQATQQGSEDSPAPSNRQVRPAQRQTNYTSSSSTSSSSSRSSTSTRSTSSRSSSQSSSSQQGSSSTARPANREP